jgi:chemotaxis protein methyltransferase CheR
MDLTHVRFDGLSAGTRGAVRRRAAQQPGVSMVAAPASHHIPGLAALVLTQAGLDPARYRPTPLRRRASACVRTMKASSEADACNRLEADPRLTVAALSTLLIGVSDFFRDRPVFDTLRTSVVASLRARGRPIRVLSVGCSSGAELYSVALMLAESQLLAGAHLLGIDCRSDAVTAARTATFPDSVVARLDAGLKSRYFDQVAGGARVVEPLQRCTEWRVVDATRDIPAGPWDLVLCRNLFIYLHDWVAEAMLIRIVDQLVPGGFLVVGKAERPPAALRLTELAHCVYITHAD